MSPRAYSMKQDSFFRPKEWEFLEREVLDVEVQQYIAKRAYNKARALLRARWEQEFTGPTGGETEEDFKKRYSFANKTRKHQLIRRRAETQEEWEARLCQLNDRLAQWLTNWCQKTRRRGAKLWHPPVIGAPKACKPRKDTAFDAFCKSEDAPKGSDFKTADGRRCDLTALNAARTAAWQSLAQEEQTKYLEATQESLAEGVGEDDSSERGSEPREPHASDGRVATAEAIATYVDEFVQVMHNDVSWGGFVIFGGPDHTGEAWIHAQTAGTNRHGQTFLDALLQVIGWNQLDFDTVFSLWLEQCRQGPQDAEDRTFAEAARRAIEHSRDQAQSPSAMTVFSNVNPCGAVMGTALGSAFTMGPSYVGPDPAAIAEALERLTLAIQPRASEIPHPPAVLAPMANPVADDAALAPMANPFADAAINNDASAALPPEAVAPPVGTPLSLHTLTAGSIQPYLSPSAPILTRGIQFTHLDPLVGPAAPASTLNYDFGCPLLFSSSAEDAMDWSFEGQPSLLTAQTEAALVEVEHSAMPGEDGSGGPSDGANAVDASRSNRRRRQPETSGVPMPDISGLPVVERVLRPRNPRNREETQDGTVPLTSRGST